MSQQNSHSALWKIPNQIQWNESGLLNWVLKISRDAETHNTNFCECYPTHHTLCMLLLETLSSNRMLHSMNFGTLPPTPKTIILNWSVMLMLLEIGSTDLLFYSDHKPLFFLGGGSISDFKVSTISSMWNQI